MILFVWSECQCFMCWRLSKTIIHTKLQSINFKSMIISKINVETPVTKIKLKVQLIMTQTKVTHLKIKMHITLRTKRKIMNLLHHSRNQLHCQPLQQNCKSQTRNPAIYHSPCHIPLWLPKPSLAHETKSQELNHQHPMKGYQHKHGCHH